MITKKNRAPTGYPRAYVFDDQRPDAFDPALRHLSRALVKGAPFAPERASTLARARSGLLVKVLETLSHRALADAVIVRGSVALERWFPGRARPAHDLDLIARDPTIAPDGDEAQRLLRDVTETVCAALAEAGVAHSPHHASVDSIWTYERAEGRRIAVPWLFRGVVDVVQVDVVFRERVISAPEKTPIEAQISVRDGWVWFATKAESLAWKLLWLEEDGYPQGKDLYDAALLAAHCELPLELLRAVFAGKGSTWRHGADTTFCRDWKADWDGFGKQYPNLPVDPARLLEDLESALRITT